MYFEVRKKEKIMNGLLSIFIALCLMISLGIMLPPMSAYAAGEPTALDDPATEIPKHFESEWPRVDFDTGIAKQQLLISYGAVGDARPTRVTVDTWISSYNADRNRISVDLKPPTKAENERFPGVKYPSQQRYVLKSTQDNTMGAGGLGEGGGLDQRIIFDDTASRSIASAGAPYVGSFRGSPDGLTDLQGCDITGWWTLEVSSQVAYWGGLLEKFGMTAWFSTNIKYETNENTALTVGKENGVLINDRDPNGRPLSAVLYAGAAHGSVHLNADGSFTYTPNQGFTGVDTFSYRAYNGTSYSNVATVNVNVKYVNKKPVAAGDSYSVNMAATLNVPAPGLLANDSDPEGDTLTAVLQMGPTKGTLNLNSNGSFTYTPAIDPVNGPYFGDDYFFYQVSDGQDTSLARVDIHVNYVPHIQILGQPGDMTINVGQKAPLLLRNYFKERIKPLTFTCEVGSINVPQGDQWLAEWSYTPTEAGTKRVTLTANVENGSPASVSFNLTANNVPTMKKQFADIRNAVVGKELSIDLAQYIEDADGDSLTYSANVGTVTGSVWKYTPSSAGSAVVTITADDQKGGTLSGSFNVTANSDFSLEVSAATASVNLYSPMQITVTAKESNGSMSANYTGTIHFSSTDGAAELPEDYTFTASDGGSHTFSVIFHTVGSHTVTVSDDYGVQGYWKLDEGSGTAAVDSSRHGHDGTLSDSSARMPIYNPLLPDSTHGVHLKSGNFKADSPTLATDNITMSVWVFTQVSSYDNNLILYNGNSASDGYGLCVRPNGYLSVLCGGKDFGDTSATLTQNSWQHVAAVRSNGTWTVYLNGTPYNVPKNPSVNPISHQYLYCGPIDAFVDDVRVYNRALSAAQISLLALGGPLTKTGMTESITVTYVPDTAAPVLSQGSVTRTGITAAEAKFSSGEAGMYYYQLDGTAPTAAELTAGTKGAAMTAAEQTINFNTLAPGVHTLYIAAKDEAGNVSNLLTIKIPAYSIPVNLKAGANLSGTQVYFGACHSNPVKWHVVAAGTGTATLWTATSMETKAYHSSAHHNNWSGSDICAWLNGMGSYTSSGFLPSAFATAEQAAITGYGTTEVTNGKNIDISQKIVLPSVEEMGAYTYTGAWNIAQSTRALGDGWWLRSPNSNDFFAAIVLNDGWIGPGGTDVRSAYAIRPAFKLNLASVMFTSAAEGGKSASAGSNLSAAEPITGAVKLTVLDSSLSLDCTDTLARTVKTGDTVDIAYSGAKTGTGKYVSCVIVNDSGTITHYGKLADCTSGNAGGTASFTVPALEDGNYTIKLFNEQCSADYYTDFCSTPVEISLTVDNTVPVTSVVVKTTPTKTIYTAGDTLDLTGLVITLNKSDSSTEDVAFANFDSQGITVSPADGTTLAISHTKVIITHTASGKPVDQAITVNAAPDFQSGSGTEADPYIITTTYQLNNVRTKLNACFKLGADIDLSSYGANYDGGAGWLPIGNGSVYFTGSFDGAGHSISNLTINRSGTDCVGFFRSIRQGAVIKNVRLTNINVNGKNSTGGLAGEVIGDYSGQKVSIQKVYVAGNVTGARSTGGLAGMSVNSNISEVGAAVDVTANTGNYAGGLVGYNFDNSFIVNSYATGRVTKSGGASVGGLVGCNVSIASVANSYAAGLVQGQGYGLAAENYGSVTASYYDQQTTGKLGEAGTAKTTAEMKQQATFVGWDFSNIWAINEGKTYPYLRWEKVLPKRSLKVTIEGEGSVDINGETVSSGQKDEFAMGTSLVFDAAADAAAGYEFAYWKDTALGSVISTSPTYECQMGASIDIKAVFKEIPSGDSPKFTVTFKGRSGKIIKSSQVAKSAPADAPVSSDLPELPGFKFIGWDKDFSNVTSNLTVNARYQRIQGPYDVTVEGGKLSTGESSGEFMFDMPVTVEADEAPDGKKFSHWTQDGVKISTKSIYSFFAPMKDIVLKAEYVDGAAVTEEVPFITLERLPEADSALTYTVHRDIPAGYELIESGVILKSGTSIGELTIDTSNALLGRIKNDSTDQFYVHKNKEGKTWQARAYLIYEDAVGNIVTVYSEQL